MQLTENAKKVLESRILRKDEEGNVTETPDEMVERVVGAIADDRMWENEFIDVMENLYFLPNSPCLMNAGIPGGQLLACFVLPIEDNMESIMGTLKDATLIHKSGGGTGFSFSNLRPENDTVKTTGGVASGPVSFMRMYDAVTQEIKQGGKRRGANIAILRCDHPDILKFIDCKKDNAQINNFNISVAITDKFMQAVKENAGFDLINPRDGKVTKTLPAREIWDKLVEGAWRNGEPGIIFIDTVNKYNPLPELGNIEGVNPCFTGDMRLMMADGSYKTFEELAGGEWEIMSSDGLLSKGKVWETGVKYTVKLNLSNGKYITCTADHKFKTINGKVKSAKKLKGETLSTVNDFVPGGCAELITVESIEPNGKHPVYDFSEPRTNWGIVEGVVAHNCGESVLLNNESCCLGSINLAKMVTNDNRVNLELLKDVTRVATRFLDSILDVTEYPLEQIKEMSLGNRKIGLGVMGWGDLLFKLGIPYNSDEALELAFKIMGFIDDAAFHTSIKLAEEKGVFPNWHKSDFFQKKYGKLRNASRTCIAPTGTLSIIAGCTSGIEPAYGLVYQKNVMDGQVLYEVNQVFEQELKDRGIYSEELLQKISQNNGSCQGIKEIPEDMQKIFVVAHDIAPEWHVKMQAEFQKNVDMGISKSINLPNSATKKDVGDAFMLAHELGCKGITVYRDGSRENQVLTTGKKDKPVKQEVKVRKRPVETSGVTTALKTGCGKLYATVNEDDHGICEIFLNQRDGNSCRVAYNNALAMVTSMALRAGVAVKDISKALKGQSCGQPVWEKGGLILSCPDAIGKHLDKEQEFQDFRNEMEPLTEPQKTPANHQKRCPDCGGKMIFQGGCETCRDCGNSRCGG